MEKDKSDDFGDVEERKRVLLHASTLNRVDVIKKVVRRASAVQNTSHGHPNSLSGANGLGDVAEEILNHTDDEGLTALHCAVRNSSLDAIRVLLRLGVDVTAKAGEHSSFPASTAYQVAALGGTKSNPEEIKQVFLAEAVQAIAQGDTKRVRQFLEAGVELSSEYGAVSDGDSSSTLAEWAQQLGQSDVLSALSTGDTDVTKGSISRTETDEKDGMGDDHDSNGQEVVAAASGGDIRHRKAETDAELFVGELREAIMALTAECEELEAILAPRGTLGIIERARTTRQELVVAEREIESAKALCDRLREEEVATVAENELLQALVVESQQAVDARRKAGLESAAAVVSVQPEVAADRAKSNVGDDVEPQDLDGDQRRIVATSSPRLESAVDDQRSGAKFHPSGRGVEGSGNDENGVHEVTTMAAVDLRKEEATALSRSLETIAMQLEEELGMMRDLERGDGAVEVVRKIRAMRAAVEAAEEDAHRTYAVARYMEARLTVIRDRGNELRSQLERLQSYFQECVMAGEKGPCAGLRAAVTRGLGKEDVGPFLAVANLEERYQGPEVDACLSSEDKGGSSQQSQVAREVTGVMREERSVEIPEHVDLVDTLEKKSQGHEIEDSSRRGNASNPMDILLGDEQTISSSADVVSEDIIDATVEPISEAVTVAVQKHGLPQQTPPPPNVGSGNRFGNQPGSAPGETETAREQQQHDKQVALPSVSPTNCPRNTSLDRDSDGRGPSKCGRKERARESLDSPGIDASKGVPGWRRQRNGRRDMDDGIPKVSVMQDVFSAVFGWEIASRKGPSGLVGGKARGTEGRGPPGASVMYA